MDAATAERLERMEAKRRAVLATIGSIPDEVLNRRPGEGEWSVVQVLAHVCLGEQLSVEQLRKRMATESPLQGVRRAGLGSRLRSMALSLALRSPLRFKAPARSTELPEHESLPALVERWDAVRADLATLLDELPPERATETLFSHPRAGRLTVGQALRFMEEHLDHHRAQVERVLARVGVA
jgi:uncharacterized damage-inducible protein DinB